MSSHSDRAILTQCIAYIASWGCMIGSAVFPPASPVLIPAGIICGSSGVAAYGVQIGTYISDAIENHTFNNTDDISKYEI